MKIHYNIKYQDLKNDFYQVNPYIKSINEKKYTLKICTHIPDNTHYLVYHEVICRLLQIGFKRL